MASWMVANLKQMVVAEQSKISLNFADTTQFIRLYRQEELLWNVNMPDHTNRAKRTECLQRISKLMGKNWTIEQIKDKIMSLRSRYSKEMVKVRVSIASGADPCYQPIWKYFPLLDSFLRPFSATRKIDTPVVRAFQKRLMWGGTSGYQIQSSPPTPVTHPPQNGSPIPAPHFFHPAGSSKVMPGRCCQRSQQGSIPMAARSYHVTNNDDDDSEDDDVQFVGQDDVSKVMEEVAMFIDDEGGVNDDSDDDDDSGYSGGIQEGGSISESLLENEKNGSRSDAVRIKHQSGSTEGERGRVCMERVGVVSDREGELGELAGKIPLNSVCDRKQTDRLQGELWTTSTASLDQNKNVRGGHHQGTHVPTHSRERPGKVTVKQERPAYLQSPPPPPLPQRLSSADLLHRDSSVFSSSGVMSGGLQVSSYDSGCSHPKLKRGPGSMDDCHNPVQEPCVKRIKQEKDDTSCTELFLCGEVDSPDLYLMSDETCQWDLPHPGSRLNPDSSSYARDCEKSNCLEQPDGQRCSSRTLSGLHGSGIPLSAELMACTSKDTERPSSKDVHSASAIAQHVTHQVTHAVSSQVTSLLQSLVSQLLEKSSVLGGVDADTAFGSYVKAELGKLDEDLKVDVKFSIQKVIYDAQKEMSHRKTGSKDSAE